MIRFNCPGCGRHYELPDLMAHLPLLCKGCGQPLAVPEPSPEPEPPLFAKPAPAPTKPASPQQVREPSSNDDDVLVTKPDSTPDIDFNVSGPTVASLSDPQQPPKPEAAANPPAALAASSGSKRIPAIVDVAVGLILLVAGVFLGEVLAQKSTREVLTEAGSAPKFPPLELLQWLGPPLFFGLIYALLISRGRSVGGWLKRRQARSDEPVAAGW